MLDEDHEPVPTKSVLIATAVRERIADGTFKPGTPLVPVLAREFEVDASTVTSALRPLAEEGLVVTKIGSGTYVSPRRPPEPDHRVYPPNPGPTQTTDPATLALRAPSDRNGVRTTSSESSPAVSPHLIGTSSRLHAARAAYQGVVDMLADTDTYPPGSKLPAHPVLADRLGVTSSALRIAMHALAADGRVHRRHSGTVVLGKDSTPVPVPTTTRLTEIVRERIQDGTIKPGQLIATALRAEFGVGNTTVRSALTPLISEGLLVAKQGVGIYASAGTASDDEPPARATPSQITEIVRKRIQDGTFKPGEPLTIRLLEELGVGRTKLQGCLAPLVNEGLLVARQGVGTYVPHPPTETTARTCPGKADTTRRTTDAARPRTRAADQ
ncbi:GntR family transcriptional regulator [Streptomyces globisporus]|uniref:GntR family transcriptional regulator n=1 Tax=Streptomyces globisporus TaxID=1908 RepID=UPI0036767518